MVKVASPFASVVSVCGSILIALRLPLILDTSTFIPDKGLLSASTTVAVIVVELLRFTVIFSVLNNIFAGVAVEVGIGFGFGVAVGVTDGVGVGVAGNSLLYKIVPPAPTIHTSPVELNPEAAYKLFVVLDSSSTKCDPS